jgi:peptide chain release factor 1
MLDRLVEQILTRFGELENELSDPAVIGDREKFTAASRAYRDVEPAAKLAAEYRRVADDVAGARELMAEDSDDAEIKELLRSSTARLEELEEEIRLAMVERDPNDDKNVIIEIRPGVGGDEAGLWAGDIYRMLIRYAERRGFKPEPLDIGDGTYTFAIKGDGAYSVFKFEGGTHRVQRVPETESQGRIHTSTATVAVLPEVDDVEVDVDQNDLHRGSWSRCRTRSHNFRTAKRRCACCVHGSTSARSPSSRRNRQRRVRRRSAPASAPRRFAPTTTANGA